MPDYLPIPGERDLPEDDLSRLASERASNILSPYGERFGLKPIVSSPSGTTANPTINPAMGLEDKLYQSIHPDTFSKVLETIMQMVTGRPIPRQVGGPGEPGQDYLVGEKGPEIFRPAVPGTIFPGREEGGHTYPDLTYAGGGERRWNPLTGTRTPGELWNQQLSAGPLKPAQGFALPERIPLPFPFAELRRRETPLQIPGESFLPETAGAAGYRKRPGDVMTIPPTGGGTTPAPRRREEFMALPPIPTTPPAPGAPGGDWIEAEGGRYRVGPERWFAGGREVPTGTPGAVSGDVLARERLFRETPRLGEGAYAGGYPVPERSYYDVHPEERRVQEIYDMLRGPHPDSYEAARERMRESHFMDIANDPTSTHEARLGAIQSLNNLRTAKAARGETARKAAGDIYGEALQYGPETPGGMEKTAHAEYLRAMPWTHLAGISEQGRAHLEGINREVAGRFEAAKITADTKNQMMHDIGIILAEGYKNPMFFDPNQAISAITRIYHATGRLTDEQWAALPNEYKGIKTLPDFETFKARAKAQGSKMSDKSLKDAYEKLGQGQR
jgi:hypothetical protein